MPDEARFAGATVIEGDVAQSEERLVCNQEVAGSNPVISTPRLAWDFPDGCSAVCELPSFSA
jgi:hypothetical protein